MSPRTPLSSSAVLNDFLSLTGQCGRKNQMDSLPFYEIESCTASKQEHIISVVRLYMYGFLKTSCSYLFSS